MDYLGQSTLLYVEDDHYVVNLILSFLKDSVKELYIAHNGKEGLEKYQKYNPDLVLTDIVMPEMDGLEMSKNIKAINPEQQIVLLTAHDDKENFVRSIDVGISKYILKPITDITLLLKSLEDMALVHHLNKEKFHQFELQRKQERVEVISALLLNIAHQWRQPLTIVSIQLSNLKLDIEMNKKLDIELLDKTLDSSLENIQYLSRIIEQLSHFFKTVEEDEENIVFNDIVDIILSYFDQSIQEQNIIIKKDIDIQKSIQCDKKLLGIVIEALIKNSIEQLSQKDDENKIIKITQKTKNGKEIISIHDSANGIEEKILDKIFDPYFSTKHQYTGVGLSLYMVYQIVKFHLHGSIEVKNENFKVGDINYFGANFTIELESDNKEE